MILGAALLLINVAWLALQVLVGSFFGARASRVQLGMGPELHVFEWRGTKLGLGLIPGGFVQFGPEFVGLSFARFGAVRASKTS